MVTHVHRALKDCYRLGPLVRPYLSSFVLILALADFGCVKSPAGPPLCSEISACAEGSVCVVGRCRSSTSTVVGSADGRRLVLVPEDLAVVSSQGDSGGGARLPAIVVLGRGASTVFLRFSVPVKEPSEVTGAFLVLEPIRDALPTSRSVPLELASILESWRADDVSEGRVPRVSVPERAGSFGGSFAGPARIDVTHFVKRWAERKSEDHGLAIIADESDAYGARFSLGVTEGHGPRLEVYLR